MTICWHPLPRTPPRSHKTHDQCSEAVPWVRQGQLAPARRLTAPMRVQTEASNEK